MKRNASEQKSPWKFEWRFDRLRPPKWKHPYLMYLHVFLKTLPLLVGWYFGMRSTYDYLEELLEFDNSQGFLTEDLYGEVLMAVLILLSLIDFFVTKNYIGPKMTGLHHGFQWRDGSLRYHYYAERDFLTRYPAVDRDSFFTFFILFSVIRATQMLRYNPVGLLLFWRTYGAFYWLTYFSLAFWGVYGNLYLYVQTRYKQEWSMTTFASAWAYNFFVRVVYEEGAEPAESCRTFYTRNARY